MSHWISQRLPFTPTDHTTIPAPQMQCRPVSLTALVEETYRDGKRWYTSGNHLYPSISTLLSATDDEGNASLKQWRARIGHTKAAEITQTAAKRGTRWHVFCEDYVTGAPMRWSVFEEPTDQAYAAFVATVLNAQIREVVATETRVASTQYGVAGRLDMAVRLQDGRVAILDFKTGKRQKSGNRLDNYALQATFYADALSEHWTLGPIDTIIIAQLLPDAIIWQESHPVLWRDSLRQRVAQFTAQQLTVLG